MFLLHKIQKGFANQMKFLALSYARQANKEMYLSAMAYNPKKYLKFIGKTVERNAKTMQRSFSVLKAIFGHETRRLGPLDFKTLQHH